MEDISWWYWVVFGIILAFFELITFTFFLLIFGISAILVGFLTWIFNFSLNMEIGLWLIISIVSIILLYPIYKRKISNKGTNIGQSNSGIGTKGIAIDDINITKRGKVKLYEAVHGSKIWLAEADKTIPKGSEIEVVDVSGQILNVK